MTQIEKIKAKIERMKENSMSAKMEWIDDGYNQNAFAEDCRIASFDKLLAFIDSLHEEQPSEGLEQAANARYPEKWKYNKKATGDYDANLPRRKAFIAGAQWKKEQMEKQAEKALAKYGITFADMVAYNKGVEEGRRMEKEETNDKIQDAIDHANKCYEQSMEDKDTEKAYYWDGGRDCLTALQRDIK